jgi:hypothetical protein
MARIKVLKPHLGPTGFVQAGQEIEIDELRQRALARNDIVPPVQGEEPAPASAGVKHALTNTDFRPRRSKIIAVPKSSEQK